MNEEAEAVISHAANAHEQIPLMSPELTLLILTWFIFILLLVILHKFAWKPILAGLDAREKDIRSAIENADKIKAELKEIHDQRDKILNEAYAKSKEVIDQSRHAAVEAAKVIERKAKEEAHIILANARQEIHAEKEKAQAELKKDAADLSILLAGKLIHENLDVEKNRKLVNQYIKEI